MATDEIIKIREEYAKTEKETNEFMKLVEKYPDVRATFASYYKYEFKFITEVEGERWEFWVGGDRDDIYRLYIEPSMILKDLRYDIAYAEKQKESI